MPRQAVTGRLLSAAFCVRRKEHRALPIAAPAEPGHTLHGCRVPKRTSQDRVWPPAEFRAVTLRILQCRPTWQAADQPPLGAIPAAISDAVRRLSKWMDPQAWRYRREYEGYPQPAPFRSREVPPRD